MPPSMKRLSVKMSAALDTAGFGLRNRDETKRTTDIVQFMSDYFCISKFISSGGRAEGTALGVHSDADIMAVVPGFLVIDGDDQINGNCICISVVRTGCYPGYCKLALSAEQLSKFDILVKTQKHLTKEFLKVMKCIKKVNGEFYISSALFMEKIIPEEMIPADNFGDVAFQRNGPATRNHNKDLVYAFMMDKWPKEAIAWSTRQRNNKWPSRECLNHIKANISCYVVGVGNKLSKDFDMEWRISFVEIERELIWSMNETQFKCYVIIKRLKEKFEKFPALEQITTYHMKNVMFWVCEELTDWKPRCLLSNVLVCLQKLEMCIRDGILSHYINPENNLFNGKKFNIDKIKIAINDLQRNGLSEIITESQQNQFIYLSPEVIGYANTCIKIWGYVEQDPGFLRILLSKFPNIDTLIACIHIVQAKAKWRNELHALAIGNNQVTEVDLLNLAKYIVDMIRKGDEMDFATRSVHIAIVYFMHGLYEEATLVLERLFSNVEWKIYVSINGSCYLCFKTNQMQQYKKKNVRNVEDLKRDRKRLVFDFCAIYQDIYKDIICINEPFYHPTLPYPFALQICIVGSRLFDGRYNPVVVSYYLLYMSRLKLGQREPAQGTLEVFRCAVHNNRKRKDYDFSLALLGHCLYWTGDIEGAFESYSKSIMIKKSVLNVSVYLMAFLINDWYTSKCWHCSMASYNNFSGRKCQIH